MEELLPLLTNDDGEELALFDLILNTKNRQNRQNARCKHFDLSSLKLVILINEFDMQVYSIQSGLVDRRLLFHSFPLSQSRHQSIGSRFQYSRKNNSENGVNSEVRGSIYFRNVLLIQTGSQKVKFVIHHRTCDIQYVHLTITINSGVGSSVPT